MMVAQTVAPLITPELLPDEEQNGADDDSIAELGFPGAPAADDATPPQGDGFGLHAGELDAEAPEDSLFEPIDAADPLAFGDFEETELPDVTMDGSSTRDDASETADAPLNFTNTPWIYDGGGMNPGMGGGWLSGFNDIPAGMMMFDDSVFGAIRQGLSLSVNLSGSYDTNPSQGINRAGNSNQGDYMMSLGASVNYRSIAPIWTYGLSYSGSYRVFFDQSDLNGYNQSAGASVNYDSGPLSASFNLGVGFGSGANRLYASVVDELSLNYSLNARYRYSPKTSFTGSFSQRITDASGGFDTNSFDLATSALWQYSPLVEFGPGVRYTRRSADRGSARTSIGPTFTVNYQVSQKVSLNSRVGMDFVSSDAGGSSSDHSYSTSVGLNYRAASYWGMSLSLVRDVQASYNRANEFEEITALRLGYNRTIRRASWNVGVGLENRSSKNSDSTVAARSDRDYLSFDTSLGMRIFADTTNASIFMRYSDQSGGANESFDSFQFGFNVSRTF